jgi:hypothetical protein
MGTSCRKWVAQQRTADAPKSGIELRHESVRQQTFGRQPIRADRV